MTAHQYPRTTTEYEVLSKLQDAGVTFVITVPDRGGFMKVEASPYDLIDFTADRDRFYAKCHLVSKDTYLSWTNDAFSVRCAHKDEGVQCEDVVPGGNSVTARKYVSLQGSKCARHR